MYENLLIFAATPSPSGRKKGCWSPPPPNFFTAKNFEIFFHRYMGIWTKGGKINRMAILAKKAKMVRGKSERGGGLQQPPHHPPPHPPS